MHFKHKDVGRKLPKYKEGPRRALNRNEARKKMVSSEIEKFHISQRKQTSTLLFLFTIFYIFVNVGNMWVWIIGGTIRSL